MHSLILIMSDYNASIYDLRLPQGIFQASSQGEGSTGHFQDHKLSLSLTCVFDEHMLHNITYGPILTCLSALSACCKFYFAVFTHHNHCVLDSIIHIMSSCVDTSSTDAAAAALLTCSSGYALCVNTASVLVKQHEVREVMFGLRSILHCTIIYVFAFLLCLLLHYA